LPVNTIKRCRGVARGTSIKAASFQATNKDYYLGDNVLKKFKKKYISGRLEYGTHQWMLFFCTMMPNLNEFHHAGMFDMGRSDKGTALFYLANFTKEERKERDLEDFISSQDLDAEREELDKSLENMEKEDE
jgi:hypothetical protein